MTNDELATLILPWTMTTKPDLYQKTLAVAGRAVAFRKYLLRLVEIRYSEEPDWRTSVPLSVLEETSIVQKMQLRPDGETITVAGKASPDRAWGFHELAALVESKATQADLLTLIAAKEVLNLELMENG